MQKEKELTFYNISRHVVKSDYGSSFPGAGLFCTYPISFLLKQSCDNNIVNCSQMILYRGVVLFWTSFQSLYEAKKYNFVSRIVFYMFSSFYVATITPPTQL